MGSIPEGDVTFGDIAILEENGEPLETGWSEDWECLHP